MKVCDLCNMSIGDDSIRYSSSQVKKAVNAGLRPAVCHLENTKGLTEQADRAIWIRRILKDNKDWFLCPECAVRFEKFLPE